MKNVLWDLKAAHLISQTSQVAGWISVKNKFLKSGKYTQTPMRFVRSNGQLQGHVGKKVHFELF